MAKKKKKQMELPVGLVKIEPFELPGYVVVFTEETRKAPLLESSIRAMNDFLIPIAQKRLERAQSRPDYYLNPRELDPSGHITADGFVVHSGSHFFGGNEPPPARIQEILTTLQRCGAITPCERGFKLETDLTFDSPATAASVLLGQEASASVWKDLKGRTIEENQAAASKTSSEAT